MYAPSTTLCLIDFKEGIYDITGQSSVKNNGVILSSKETIFDSYSGEFNHSELDNILIDLSEEASSISIWFYAVGDNQAGWYPTIFSSQANSNSGGTYIHISDGAYGEYPQYRVNEVNEIYNNGVTGDMLILRNQWHHLMYCRDESNMHYFFLDGELQASIYQGNYNKMTTIAIGGLLQTAANFISGCYFTGYIGEILITKDCLHTENFKVPSEKYKWIAPVVPPVTIGIMTNYNTYEGSISNVVDGDNETYWWAGTAQESGQYILFIFNNAVIFNGITVVTNNNVNDCLSSGNILQISTDGNTWDTIGYFSGGTECSFSNLNIKDVLYVRIYAENSSDRWLCVNEIILDYDEIKKQKFYLYKNSWMEVKSIYKRINGEWVSQEYYRDLFDNEKTYVTKFL